MRSPAVPLPRRPADFGLVSWDGLVSWSFLQVPVRMRTVAAMGGIGTIALVAGLLGNWTLATLAFVLLILVGAREHAASPRRAARLLDLARRDAAHLELEDLRASIERALDLEPDNDAARFWLACLFLEQGSYLSALVQLRPLAGRHPTASEIQLVLACTYAHLALHENALRVLDTLNETREHPSFSATAAVLHHCQSALGYSTSAAVPST